MTDDRSNAAFAITGLSNGLSQWPIDRTELWGPLIIGAQEWCGRCSSLSKQWLDFIQRQVVENIASLWPNASSHAVRPFKSGASTQSSCKMPPRPK